MNIQIIKANIDYLEEVLKLNNDLFELEKINFDEDLKLGWTFDNDGKEYFKDMINKDNVLIAIFDNKVIGYLAGTIGVNCSYIIEKTAEVDNMYIDSLYRDKGVGKLLIAKFKEKCIEQDVKRVIVTASSKNINAIEFYKKNGFNDYDTTLKANL